MTFYVKYPGIISNVVRLFNQRNRSSLVTFGRASSFIGINQIGSHSSGQKQQLQGRTMSSSSSSSDDTNQHGPPTPLQQEFYRYFLPIQTRIGDADLYGHINNVVYYSYADTIINHFLKKHCGLKHPRVDPTNPNIVGFMVDTHCIFKYPFEYPEVVLCGLTITKLGNSSVTYTVGMFPENGDGGERRSPSLAAELFSSGEVARYDCHKAEACAVAKCVHVFVDLNGDRRPVRIPESFTIPCRKILKPFEYTLSKL